MRYVSATDAKQRLAALLDAAQREPVMIDARRCMTLPRIALAPRAAAQ